MPKQELNLLHLTACRVTQAGAGAAEVMWGEIGKIEFCGVSLTTCHTTLSVMPSPHVLPALQTQRKTRPVTMPAADSQLSRICLTPVWNPDGTNMAALANQIHDGPVVFPPL